MTERFEYFVSFCVMTEDCNPFGHSFMLISILDHAQGQNARLEVLEAAGFYSRYMPVLGFKPKSPGRVKAERTIDIVEKNGLSHKTFQITMNEMASLLTAINQDRRMVGNDRPIENTEQYRPGGPYFNLFRGNNCKKYALQKLESIGIDVRELHGFLEIPKLSQHLSPLKISKSQRDNHEVFYWNCPFVLSPRQINPTPLERDRILPQRAFYELKMGTQNSLALLLSRATTLKMQGKEVTEINIAIKRLQEMNYLFTQQQSYLNTLDRAKINQWHATVQFQITQCVNALRQRQIETGFSQLLLDSAKELFRKICYVINGNEYLINKVEANSNDLEVLQQAQFTARLA